MIHLIAFNPTTCSECKNYGEKILKKISKVVFIEGYANWRHSARGWYF